MPLQTSVPGILLAMPLWGGVPPNLWPVIVLSLPFPFPQLGRRVSLWPGVCLWWLLCVASCPQLWDLVFRVSFQEGLPPCLSQHLALLPPWVWPS